MGGTEEEMLRAAFEEMSLHEIIRTQDWLSRLVRRRFGRDIALMFTDIAGSTKYFNQFGDEAGRRLQQRHIETFKVVLAGHGGRIVDTAGDGAFAVCPSGQAGAEALIELLNSVDQQNSAIDRAHRIHLRCGLHWGSVLTDGEAVTGDSVNVAARVSSTANLDEIRLSRAAFNELAHTHRLRCRRLGDIGLRDVANPIELLTLNWLDASLFPGHVLIEQTGTRIDLPHKPTIAFGRLQTHQGVEANDVVLSADDPEQDVQISRWHFELRRSPKGFVLRQVSRGRTEVDGELLQRGEERLIKSGTVVEVARVLTLRFQGGASRDGDQGATIYTP